MARRPGRQAHRTRPGSRHHRLHRRGHGGSPRGVRTSAARHRRSADGRHERGRRPVRLGPDVPAAGGEVGAGDEAGRGSPGAFHGGRKGRSGASGRRQDPDGHGQGRRPRHRQEHRRRRASVQQLRGRRSGRHGPSRPHPGRGDRAQGRHRRPVGPDHAVAGRNDLRRRRDGAARLRHSPADRGRHDQPHPYGREDRTGLSQGLDHLCHRRQPGGRRGVGPAVPHRQGEERGGHPRRIHPHPRAIRPRPGGEGPRLAAAGARQPLATR